MAAKMLDEVLAKEKQTAENEQKANEAAVQIIENAELKAKEITSAAQKAVADYESKVIAEAQKKAQSIEKKANENALDSAKLLKAQADSKLSEAVGAIREVIAGK